MGDGLSWAVVLSWVVKLVPQPPLNMPQSAVYVLVSPMWNKVYVGAFGFKRPRPATERWKEHLTWERLWSSRMSQTRFVGRCPPLYAAMRSVGVHNVVMVILQSTTREALSIVERRFIKLLSPVFNIAAVNNAIVLMHQAAASLKGSTLDDR